MARARNIKPGFFKNEDLAECSFAARLCFAGLWTLADREGRLEDRPKRIKAELFAFDSIEVEPLIAELQGRGFLVRYRNSDGSFIQISKFAAHQTPHYTEKQSVIKAPELQEPHPPSRTVNSKSPPGADDASRGGHYPLNPDSLNPDSLNPDSRSKPASQVTARPLVDRQPLAIVEPPKAKGPPDCPHQAVLAIWAEELPALPQHLPEQWRGARADHLRARWRETATAKRWASADDGLAYFRRLFGYVGQSSFLTGRAAPNKPGGRPFVIELEWLVKPANWAKVHEGKYHPEAAAS